MDKKIIQRFEVILKAINVSQYLNADKFGQYALDTFHLLNKKYSFWTLTPTVHKILFHGKEIILNTLLPIGTLSKEAMEHRNKEFKNYRGERARQTSRIENLTDIFNRFLFSSDLFINSLRTPPNTLDMKKELSDDVKSLLLDITIDEN